jgi:hypothetical protein
MHRDEFLAVFEENLTGASKKNPAAEPIEEFLAALLLQRPDLGANGGLCAIKLLGRSGKTLVPRYFQECRDLI